ncbi:basic proline-rich protein-like [Sus scrofa]|uniref:basic proline-rich protein-like n=1 Tax=Sus scrofa TaxID=9823 RepID=UPI000A2B8511|nr:basic proline-rich protein-like [Sus scrofa]
MGPECLSGSGGRIPSSRHLSFRLWVSVCSGLRGKGAWGLDPSGATPPDPRPAASERAACGLPSADGPAERPPSWHGMGEWRDFHHPPGARGLWSPGSAAGPCGGGLRGQRRPQRGRPSARRPGGPGGPEARRPGGPEARRRGGGLLGRRAAPSSVYGHTTLNAPDLAPPPPPPPSAQFTASPSAPCPDCPSRPTARGRRAARPASGPRPQAASSQPSDLRAPAPAPPRRRPGLPPKGLAHCTLAGLSAGRDLPARPTDSCSPPSPGTQGPALRPDGWTDIGPGRWTGGRSVGCRPAPGTWAPPYYPFPGPSRSRKQDGRGVGRPGALKTVPGRGAAQRGQEPVSRGREKKQRRQSKPTDRSSPNVHPPHLTVSGGFSWPERDLAGKASKRKRNPDTLAAGALRFDDEAPRPVSWTPVGKGGLGKATWRA